MSAPCSIGRVRTGVATVESTPSSAPARWAISAAAIAHKAGALLAVDSTVATPVLTRPIELGADIVMHSATKYLNGHSDIIAGALVGARDDEHWAKLRMIRAQLGTILGQTEAWLLMRGMRTLFPRVQWACRSAETLAQKFAEHPMVAEVLYPGLPSFGTALQEQLGLRLVRDNDLVDVVVIAAAQRPTID